MELFGTIRVKADVSTPIAPARAKKGASFAAYGYLKPTHVAGTYPVRIYAVSPAEGRWVSKGYVKAKARDFSTYTKYVTSMRLPSAGRWRLRAYHSCADHIGTWSSYRYVTVR